MFIDITMGSLHCNRLDPKYIGIKLKCHFSIQGNISSRLKLKIEC